MEHVGEGGSIQEERELDSLVYKPGVKKLDILLNKSLDLLSRTMIRGAFNP